MTHTHKTARGVEVGFLKPGRDAVERDRKSGSVGSAFIGKLAANETLGDRKGTRILGDPLIPCVGERGGLPPFDEECRTALDAS